MTFGPPLPDELPGFSRRTLALKAEDDGPLSATLVYPECPQPSGAARGTVLYLHGFVDYFFQTHLAAAISTEGFRFFALDLRRYGRSLHPQNRPNYARHVDDYFEELSAAIDFISEGGPVSIVAHSTGGLIASIYAKRGPRRQSIERLVLNSPFFRFPTTPLLEVKLRLARQIGRLLPKKVLPQKLNRVYGATIHASEQGTFDYDLRRKPLGGFPFFGGWIDMILSAQEEVEAGLGLSQPVLVLHSASSTRPGSSPAPEDFSADTVLRVGDIARLAPRLGPRVSIQSVPGGLHDLVLSAPAARQDAIARILAFLRAPSVDL